MPHTVIMQGLSTAFATIMTVTVISFPTPRDLYDTMFPPSDQETAAIVNSGIAPNLPGPVENLTPDEIGEQLAACSDSLGAAVPFWIEACRNTIMLAGQYATQHPEDEATANRVKLATALYCRVEWVSAAAESRNFDLKSCEGVALALAN